MNMGNKIREMRKKRGLNMKELARRIGVSYLTIQRIETDKVSPSVAVLSEIAHHLGEPIMNFFENERKFAIIKAGTTPKVQSGKMELELLVPKGVISDHVSVTLGRIKANEFISIHTHKGFEMTYSLKGDVLFHYGGKKYKIKQGDLVYFDASIEHALTALDNHEFLSIYFRMSV
jgi:DNA-binding XRE family transcriptional regulator